MEKKENEKVKNKTSKKPQKTEVKIDIKKQNKSAETKKTKNKKNVKRKKPEEKANTSKVKKIKRKNRTKENNPSFSLIEVIIIVLLTTIIVSIGSGLLIYNNYEKIASKTKGASNNIYIEEIESAFNKITQDYLENVDKQSLTNSAIEGMFNYLNDPYSSYLNKDQTEELTQKLEGTYEGVGIEITDTEKGIKVNRVFEGPAKDAGLKAGDIISEINGDSLKGKTASYLSNYIKYKSKDKVNLVILRNGKTKTLKLNKKTIDYPTVYSEKYNDVGYIYIESFAKKTSEQFETTVNELEDNGIKGLVIDLRGNTGGYLNSAYDIAEQFLIKGKTVYQLKEKAKTKKYKTKKPDKKDYKITILIDGRSASASEVLALALKENYNATIVGEKSYGKGSVQQTSELVGGGIVKYTTAKWLSPSGESVEGKGIVPDVNIIYEEPKEGELDNQLKKALELLK